MPHRVVVWVILADFDRLSVVVVVAVGMWATRLRCPSCPQRCYGVGERESSGERESLSQSGFALLAVVQDGRAVRQVLQLALLQGSISPDIMTATLALSDVSTNDALATAVITAATIPSRYAAGLSIAST
jgi:hypothetical protein